MEQFQKFKNRKWYHQRFDGSPVFLVIIGRAETCKEPRKPEGLEARWRVCFFEKGRADWFLDQEDIDRGAKIVSKMSEKEDNLSQKLMPRWVEDVNNFEKYFLSFKPAILKTLEDQGLVDEFEKYIELARKRFTSSSIIDHFALGTDYKIAEMIRRELGPFKNESEFTHIFSVLTSPVHQSFINQAEIGLLEVAISARKLGSVEDLKIKNAILGYQKKFFWTQNNYIKSKVISTEEFKSEIKKWLDSGKNLYEELEIIKNVPVKNKKEKAEFLPKLSKNLQKLLKISESFTWWQDERKKATFLSTFLGDQILAEMSSRRGIDLNLLKYLLPNEVRGWFLDQEVSETDLAKRSEKCAVILEDGNENIYISEELKELAEIIGEDKDAGEIQDIRGLVASTGRAIGKAKIILSSEDIGLVDEGDILFAVMTRPDYLPAIKKAAAIVTDEGGITSHAAIVSRELGKPCIIGTKIATKIFKDGDKVEVNANHNWVRKIS